MKKYLLLCLVAVTALLASMQTYATACSVLYPVGSDDWKECTALCLLDPAVILCL